MKSGLLQLLSIVLFTPAALVAQYPCFTNFTIDDGLTSNKVYNIVEDRYGFIWIATDHGVSRYDGVGFTNFTTKNGLADNEVLGLFEDCRGRMWFLGFGTEPCYYLDGKVYNAGNDNFLGRIKAHKMPGSCMSFIVQHNNSLGFLIEEQGQKLIAGTEITDIPLKYHAMLSGDLYQHILLRDTSRWFAISSAYQIFWKPNDSLDLLPLALPALNMYYAHHPGETLFGLDVQNRQVVMFTPKTAQARRLSLGRRYTDLWNIRDIHVLKSDSGYVVYDSAFANVIDSAKLPFSAERIYIDRKGNKWFGSFDKGIYLIRRSAPFKIELPSAMSTGILGMAVFENTLLLRTEKNGLLRVSGDGKCSRVFYSRDIFRVTGYAGMNDAHFIGTDDGLYVADRDFSRVEILYRSAVKDIEHGAANEILVGMRDGVLIYNVIDGTLQRIDHKRTVDLWQVSDTEVWLGGLKGLRRCTRSAGSCIAEPLHLHKKLDQSRIADIRQDRRGNTWIATDQNGLFLVTPAGSVVHFSEHGDTGGRLVSDMCLQLEVDESDRLWVATVNGVSVVSCTAISPEPAFSVSNYSLPEGMPGKTISAVAFLEGRIFIATPNGLFMFHDFPVPGREAGETVITHVQVNGVESDQKNALTLPYDQNNLIISYASSFINTHTAYRFAYRIRGLGDDWIETNTLQVPLLGIEPGEYTFEIKSLNAHGDTGKTAAIQFTVLSPWFRQWWFITSVAGVLIFSVGYYYKLTRDRILLSRNLTLLKLRILRAQLNPHFLFNALGSVQRLIKTGSLKQAESYLGTLAHIMRKSIDYSGEEFIELEKELEYTRSYLEIEKLRFGDKFDFSFHTPIAPAELSSFFVPPLILQPILENAIKHAFKGIQYKGELRVSVEKTGETMLRYTISDNGRGFDTSVVPPKHYGLGITRERIALLYRGMKEGGRVDIHSSTVPPHNGTTVCVDLPVLKD